MRYRNAQDVFPKDILALMQEYADGEYVYIPRKAENRKQWGENTRSKDETHQRNCYIYARFQTGQKVKDLAIEFFLSEKSIQRIIKQGKSQQKKE